MANLHKQEEWQNYLLKVDINCCKECKTKLKKRLLKLHGIETVHVDADLNLVSLKTQLDSEYIIKKINEWGKNAELLHGKEENNLHSYSVELNDDDDEEEEKQETPRPPLHQHKDSSTSCNHSKTKTKSQIFTEWPEHICKDKYCTVHKRDIYSNYVGNYSPPYRGNIGNNYPPRMRGPYGLRPPPGYYNGQRMMPPYGGYEVPMNMGMPGGFAGYSGDEHSNGCNIM